MTKTSEEHHQNLLLNPVAHGRKLDADPAITAIQNYEIRAPVEDGIGMS